MNRQELKVWAKSKIKGHVLELLVVIMVGGILANLSFPIYRMVDGKLVMQYSIPLGIFFAFVEVGLVYYMTNFINDKACEFKDLFKFSKDWVRMTLTKLLEGVFVFLWSLLFIIPGIIKAYAYSLVSFLLADEKYKDLSYTDLLKKSEEMMNGHKMDLFIFDLSFIGWHFLAIFTLGLLEIWISPYYTTARMKMLSDIYNK